VLSLKRFEFRDVSSLVGRQGVAHREKIDTFVDFPLESLDLLPYCTDTAAPKGPQLEGIAAGVAKAAAAAAAAAEGESQDGMYDLFAVCNHNGRMGVGHYTAVARDINEWNGISTSEADAAAVRAAREAAAAAAAAAAAGGLDPAGAAAADSTVSAASIGGPWFCFDDRHVSSVENPAHVVTAGAYILFYRKRPATARK
jgi:hypothetical protein